MVMIPTRRFVFLFSASITGKRKLNYTGNKTNKQQVKYCYFCRSLTKIKI